MEGGRTVGLHRADPGVSARPPALHRTAILLLALPLTFLAVLFVYPLADLLRQSLWSKTFTLEHYRLLFGTSVYLQVLGRTFQLAFFTSVLCLLVGYPVAYYMLTAKPRIQAIIIAAIILPFWTSALVRSLSWIALLGRGGVVNAWLQQWGLVDRPLQLVFNTTGVYIGTVHFMLPYMIFCLYSAMRMIDRNLIRAAHTLGGSPVRVFLRVFLPLSWPGVSAGFLLVFILSLGFFITPAVLGGLGDITFVMLIEKLMNELLNWPMASAAAVLLLVVTFVLYSVLGRFFGFAGMGISSDRSTDSPGVAALLDRAINAVDQGAVRAKEAFARVRQTFAARFARNQVGNDSAKRVMPAHRSVAKRRAPSTGSGRTVATFAWMVVAYMVVPILLIVILSFGDSYNLEFPPKALSLRWFEKYFSRTDWTSATVTSFHVAIIATGIATALGMAAALGLSKVSSRLRSAIIATMLAPMIVPAAVFAVGIYLLFAKIGLTGTKIGIGLAHAVLVFPLAVVVIFGALQALDPLLARAAGSLGAGPWRTFRYVTFPLIRPAVVTAALLAFLTSFDEVVVALFLSGALATTLPRKLYESIRMDTDPTMVAASVVLIGLTVVIFAISTLIGRQQGGGGPESKT